MNPRWRICSFDPSRIDGRWGMCTYDSCCMNGIWEAFTLNSPLMSGRRGTCPHYSCCMNGNWIPCTLDSLRMNGRRGASAFILHKWQLGNMYTWLASYEPKPGIYSNDSCRMSALGGKHTHATDSEWKGEIQCIPTSYAVWMRGFVLLLPLVRYTDCTVWSWDHTHGSSRMNGRWEYVPIIHAAWA